MATWSKAANLHTVFGHSWYLIYLDILDCFGVLLRHAAACCNSVLAVISLVPTVFILTRFFFFFTTDKGKVPRIRFKDVLSAALLLWPRMLLMKPGSQVLEWRLRLQESIAVGCTGCADDYGCNLKSQREKMKTSKTVRECSTSLRLLLVLTVYGCHMACQCLSYCQASRWTWQTIMTESCITCHPVTKTTLFLTCTVLLTICFHLRDSSPSCFPRVVLVQILAADIYIYIILYNIMVYNGIYRYIWCIIDSSFPSL